MIDVDVIPKNWGNSIAFVIPKDVAKKTHVKINQAIKIFIPERKVDLRKIFGTLKFKRSTQAIKNELRKGWLPEH
ncbi:MAG: hypothetical protein AB1571_02550 [Nanoarchaeota archaeon]